jgi:hypothetical protein
MPNGAWDLADKGVLTKVEPTKPLKVANALWDCSGKPHLIQIQADHIQLVITSNPIEVAVMCIQRVIRRPKPIVEA